jgi:16S rRNA processing protein RimM
MTGSGRWLWKAARILSPFGRSGALKIRPLPHAAEIVARAERVCLTDADGEARLAEVKSVRRHQSNLLMTFADIETIADADRWTGGWLQLPEELEPETAVDEYRVSELVGMKVSTVTGRVIGIVDDILHYPAHDLLKVGEALIPAVKAMVKQVDQERRCILVDLPEGLLPGETPDAAD